MSILRKHFHEMHWDFKDFHTGYPSHPVHGEYGTLYLRYTGTCSCGLKLTHAARAPAPISELFFENFQRCMAADPRVKQNKGN